MHTATAIFRTRPELKARVDNLAKKTNRPAAFYYNLLLEDYLDELEDIYLAEKTLEEIRAGKQRTWTSDEVWEKAGF